jgi:RNA polymerase primary sigma factor
LNRIAQFAQLSPKEEVELTLEAQKDNTDSLEKIVNANSRLVVSIAKQYQNQGLSLKDLVAEGNVGLVKAVLRFKSDSDLPFRFYAIWWIRQTLLQALAENSRLKRLKSNSIKELEKLNDVYIYLEEFLNREPSIKELAEASLSHSMSMPHAKLLSVINPIENSIDQIQVKLPSEAINAEKTSEMLEFISSNLGSFSHEEATVCSFYFKSDLSNIDETANHFNLSRDETASVISKTIRKIRHLKRSNRS